MKYFLVVLLISATSSFASDYNTEAFDCSISMEKSTISRSNIKLPVKKEFSVKVVTTNKDWPTYAPRKVVSDNVTGNLQNKVIVGRSFLGDITAPELAIRFKRFSSAESKEILEDLGEQVPKKLRGGFNFGNLTFDESCNVYTGAWASSESKVRVRGSNDGLLYRASLSCHKRSCN